MPRGNQGDTFNSGLQPGSSTQAEQGRGRHNIIHRNTLKVRKVDAGRSLTFEYLFLELAGRSIISIIYCPPNSSIPTFLEEFMDWVYHLLNRYMDPLILEDFNVNLSQQGEPNSAAFLELLETYGLMQWVLDPTHQSGSLLDHVITREASPAVLDKPMVLDLVSNHRLILSGIPKLHVKPLWLGSGNWMTFLHMWYSRNLLMCSNFARKQMIQTPTLKLQIMPGL